MKDNGLRVLLVSSRPPEHSANLGDDIVNALQKKGCIVDFLSLYPSTLNTKYRIYSVLSKAPKSVIERIVRIFSASFSSHLITLLKPFKKILRNTINILSKKQRAEFHRKKSGFYYFDESKPDIDPEVLLSKIPQSKRYDFIITLFWQNMLNSTSLKALYNRFKAPIYIYSVDMAPMTGGCFYFNTCDRYKYGCGNCPCLSSINPNDRSHHNYLIKQHNYSESSIFYLGNSWMIKYALASRLFDIKSVLNFSIILNETVFHPKKIFKQEQILAHSLRKDVILLARSSEAKRKGGDIILYAIKHLWQHLSIQCRQRICLVTVGDKTLQKKFKGTEIAIINLGVVDMTKLICAYQKATLFLNPSTDDAGPSMVNQAIMCGTPVVSFNLGTAVDVIENGISGFKTDNISKEGFAEILGIAIDAILNNKYPHIRETARETALKYNTSQVFADKLLGHYYRLQN